MTNFLDDPAITEMEQIIQAEQREEAERHARHQALMQRLREFLAASKPIKEVVDTSHEANSSAAIDTE